jgi:hypothetical protein
VPGSGEKEKQVAVTLEKVAEHRPEPHAERLRGQAEEARRFAAQERDLSVKYDARSDDDESRLAAGSDLDQDAGSSRAG